MRWSCELWDCLYDDGRCLMMTESATQVHEVEAKKVSEIGLSVSRILSSY